MIAASATALTITHHLLAMTRRVSAAAKRSIALKYVPMIFSPGVKFVTNWS
jgi:hypothetical protein